VSLVPRGQVVVHAQLVDNCGFALQTTVQVSEQRDRNGFQKVERHTHALQLNPDNFKPRQPLSRLNLDQNKGSCRRLVALQRTRRAVGNLGSATCRSCCRCAARGLDFNRRVVERAARDGRDRGWRIGANLDDVRH